VNVDLIGRRGDRLAHAAARPVDQNAERHRKLVEVSQRGFDQFGVGGAHIT
jgi:hypothetical protein